MRCLKYLQYYSTPIIYPGTNHEASIYICLKCLYKASSANNLYLGMLNEKNIGSPMIKGTNFVKNHLKAFFSEMQFNRRKSKWTCIVINRGIGG